MTQLTPLTGSSTLARADSLVATELGNEVVIVSLESGFFFLLNGTGSRIWDLLEAPCSLDAITETLIRRFAIAPEDCRRDVGEFIQLMLDKGLLKQT